MRSFLAFALLQASSSTAFIVSGTKVTRDLRLCHGQTDTYIPRKLRTHSCIEEQTDRDAIIYEDLCHEIGILPGNPTYLQTSATGVRGVHVAQSIVKGDTIFKIPLSSHCLRDDVSPMAPDINAADSFSQINGLLD
ncbi:hypothetical protein MPSEU_000902700 [Mayamaea pseudoterrestris]|nr:hypothetical protein MPSEU_000902700 [Mayamaea pseudoterrestris]